MTDEQKQAMIDELKLLYHGAAREQALSVGMVIQVGQLGHIIMALESERV